MGNTQKGLNNHKNRINGKDYQEEVNSEDEKNNEENNFKLSEYDKELSRVIFDEENKANEEENGKNEKMNKKKTLKDELQSYADQIAEERFMEEINMSKSVGKYKEDKNKHKLNKYLNENEVEEFNEFKKWKETQKPKNANNNKNNNINIKPIKPNQLEKTNTNLEGIKKTTVFQNRINMFENHKNSDSNHKKDSRTMVVQNNKKEFLKQTLKNYTLNAKTFRNELHDNDIENYMKAKNNTNVVNDKQKLDQNLGKELVDNNNNKPEQKNKKYENIVKKLKKSVLNVVEKVTNRGKEKENTLISKNIYQKMRKEDIKVVALYLKNGNTKYEQGLQLCGLRNYKNAITCFAHSRNSFMQLKKMIFNNKNNNHYPEEFKNVINTKLIEKLRLVNQSIKECSEFLKNGKNNAIANSKTPNDILKKLHFKNQDNENINTNFSQIDDSFDFDFNSSNPNTSPNLRGKNPNVNQNANNAKNGKNTIQDEDTEMDEKIATEIMQTNPGVKFSDIIGMQEMKKILYEIIIVPQIRPDLFTGIRKPQRGILLFGPPGTGKTMIAKAIASECNSTFFNISASSLTSKWVGESEKTVKSLFKLAYQKAPSIIFIDEIDSILSKRNESENEATKRLKTEFLIQFDGLGSNTNAKLLVIAATNRPMDLDEALLRRLPKRVYCGPLDAEGRFDFIKKVINRVETNLKDSDIMEIAKMTNGYSNSDLKELCKEAAFQPVRELTMEQILHIKKFRPIVKNDLIKAVKKIRGTMSNKIINELIKWNSQFGGV